MTCFKSPPFSSTRTVLRVQLLEELVVATEGVLVAPVEHFQVPVVRLELLPHHVLPAALVVVAVVALLVVAVVALLVVAVVGLLVVVELLGEDLVLRRQPSHGIVPHINRLLHNFRSESCRQEWDLPQ